MEYVARNLMVQRHDALETSRLDGRCAGLRNRSGCRRFAWFCLLVVTLTATPGCNVFFLAKRTLKYEPRDFDLTLDEAAACEQYARWAEEAWGAYLDTAPSVSISPDFERGFREGFVDFVFAGGTGEPPAVPPRHFWRTMYRNPHGDQAINDWSSGFRTGASAAHHGGFRDRALVPVFAQLDTEREVRHQFTPWQTEQPILTDPTILQEETSTLKKQETKDPRPDQFIEAPVEPPVQDNTTNVVPPDGSVLPIPNESDAQSPAEETFQEENVPRAPRPARNDLETQVTIPPTSGTSEQAILDDLPSTRPSLTDPGPGETLPDPDQDIARQTDPDDTSDPFLDDPVPIEPADEIYDQASPDQPIPDDALDDNPFDPLPGIDEPIELPDEQQDALPDDDQLFEDLFGPNGATESEAYRRQTPPSDRVIQDRNHSIPGYVKRQPATPFADQPQGMSRRATARNAPQAPLAEIVTSHVSAGAEAASVTVGDTLVDGTTETRPLTRNDWVIGESTRQANMASEQPANLPDLPEPTEVDRIADRLVGVPHHGFTIANAPPTTSQTRGTSPAVVPSMAGEPLAAAPGAKSPSVIPADGAAADALGKATTSLSAEASRVVYESLETAHHHASVDQRVAPALSASLVASEFGSEPFDHESLISDSFGGQGRESLDFELSLDQLDSKDDTPTESLTVPLIDGPNGQTRGFREIQSSTSEGPVKIVFPPRRSKRHAAESLFDAVMNRKPPSSTTADKSTPQQNATQRALKAARALQGPVKVRTGYQRYSGLFQN